MGSGERRRILLAADWYPPAFRAGGPVRSVAHLAALAKVIRDELPPAPGTAAAAIVERAEAAGRVEIGAPHGADEPR